MTAKELLKRSYYALTITVFVIFCMTYFVIGHVNFPQSAEVKYIGISFFALISLGVCWIMTRQNPPRAFKWYAGVIIAMVLIFIYFPLFYVHMDIRVSTNAKAYTLMAVCCLCVGVSAFLSNTKYHNILPNQSKGVSTAFRVMSWIGQIAVWGYGFALLLTVLGVIK